MLPSDAFALGFFTALTICFTIWQWRKFHKPKPPKPPVGQDPATYIEITSGDISTR